MQMSSVRTDRTPAAAGALVLALATLMAGCASKNPLIDEPAPAAKAAPAAPAVSAAPATASAAPAAADTSAGTVVQSGPTGIYRFLGFLAPYRIEIQQGNFVSREAVAQLEEGMKRPEGVTREQVRFVLGTPLLTDPFHADRWDYVFRLKKRSGEVIASRVTAYFEGNRLARIEGDKLPTEQEYLGLIAGSK
ncbi:outer membrane protein assembly factor BamE [Noviherbaspirillum aridicola]|uniref:Outer membrane protein assembly factor BamE n=1 Tax=Noviherbaspirillum aridicola TaxID=2849687 RepID=A0ABQ4Q8K5_9BURK|nr:outer membrane protein assembly factor BamE [Noviherbaspirillum aridicola]GIZ53242.1 hypothetical protein NCCP691_32560 [Noviherbaspirillum aridicola]